MARWLVVPPGPPRLNRAKATSRSIRVRSASRLARQITNVSLRALRMIAEDERRILGRTGLLAHSYMLRPNGRPGNAFGANVGGSAVFHRGLVLGVAGSFFTLSEMMLVSCITC
jgi:hypothetical protein